MSPRHLKSCACHAANPNKWFKRDLRPFEQVVQIHQILHLAPKTTSKSILIFTHAYIDVLATCRKRHAYYTDENVRRPAHVTQKRMLQTSKCSENAMPATRNWYSSKNEHDTLVKRALQKRGLRASASCENSFGNGRWGNFSAARPKNTAQVYDTTSTEHWAPTLTARISVWPHCLGKNALKKQQQESPNSAGVESQCTRYKRLLQ